MFLPGQPVYIKIDKKIGIYLGMEHDEKYPRRPTLFVWRFEPNEKDCDSYYYEQDDLLPITQDSEASLTKSEILYGPLIKPNATFSDSYPQTYWEGMVPKIKKECKRLLKLEWITKKYEITND